MFVIPSLDSGAKVREVTSVIYKSGPELEEGLGDCGTPKFRSIAGWVRLLSHYDWTEWLYSEMSLTDRAYK